MEILGKSSRCNMGNCNIERITKISTNEMHVDVLKGP